MAKTSRDDFSEKTKRLLANQADGRCSDPSCRRPTVGSNSDGDGVINLGMAAHICAAAPGGPRSDPKMTSAQRKAADNGIWMCRLHGTAVDAKDSAFTVELLRQWKTQVQRQTRQNVLYYKGVPQTAGGRSPDASELGSRLRAAAAADLEVFRRSDKWPSTSIPLTLEVGGLSDPVSTSALATALATLDDLILVAPPGMGKTTTLFQIAEALVKSGNTSPIVIPLGEWSTDTVSLIEFALRRPAFRGISEDNLRHVAAAPGVILLLDGWNELDAIARKRAGAQVKRLQMEIPELSLLISTRKQALDVPVEGTRVNLLPLNRAQQLDIARALRGDAGTRMVDQARRTVGVRELVTIPLYLSSLLALPEDAPFPTTKEELLRSFVAVHEDDVQRVEALSDVTYGLHQRFLEDLATTATRAASTAVSEADARRAVSATAEKLVAEGQISDKPQPSAVLEALVNHHTLVRADDAAGYSFQHQQFQEWYASHFAERLIVRSVGDRASAAKLKAEILDQYAWEEAILFACERLARGGHVQQEACAAAILAGFEVDPMLAAEMIFRSTDAVWARIGTAIQGLIKRWHTQGKVDRALGFMIRSGRPEFLQQLWPLITHENEQTRLAALSAGGRLRPSVLGKDAARLIAAQLPGVRKNLLCELAYSGGIDGFDLVAAATKDDPDPEVRAEVVEALSVRRADQHVAAALEAADEKTFELLADRGLIDEVDDEGVQRRVAAARKRRGEEGVSAFEQLRWVMAERPGTAEQRASLTAIIAGMRIDNKQDAAVSLMYRARDRYLREIADGLLLRVRSGATLFYGAGDLLAMAGISLEDDDLVAIVLAENNGRDDRADAAASVLGPQAVGRVIAAVLEARTRIRGQSGKYDKAASDRCHQLEARLAHAPAASLIAAVRLRSPRAGSEEIACLAEMIARHPSKAEDRGRTFDDEVLTAIRELAEDWGNRLLASGDADRRQFATIATLASRSPSVSLLPLLKLLLDENLRRFRAFVEQAKTTNWRQGRIVDEARAPNTHEYQRAFEAINAPETAALMYEYLPDEHFGPLAARVLAGQWTAAHEPDDGKRITSGVDFSRVAERRTSRAENSSATSAEAEAIFGAIDALLVDGASEDATKNAVALGIIAARLPHGQRDATIQKLLALAPRRPRAALLASLVLSGESIDIDVVKRSIAEVFEAAKKQRWILSQSNGYELREWLRLLPFVNRPAEVVEVVEGLPNDQRTPDLLKDMIVAFVAMPSREAEEALFGLAKADPSLYASVTWRNTAIRRGTLSAARGIVDLAASGAFEDKSTDRWHFARQLAELIGEHRELREHVYGLLKQGVTSPGLALLAQAIAENPDTDGLLLLVKMEIEQRRSFLSWQTIENVVTEKIPSESWKGAYEVLPAPAVELRRRLLAMTTDGGLTDVAASCLNDIDKIRDRHGAPEDEPRHPDLASGKPWPIMTADPDASDS